MLDRTYAWASVALLSLVVACGGQNEEDREGTSSNLVGGTAESTPDKDGKGGGKECFSWDVCAAGELCWRPNGATEDEPGHCGPRLSDGPHGESDSEESKRVEETPTEAKECFSWDGCGPNELCWKPNGASDDEPGRCEPR